MTSFQYSSVGKTLRAYLNPLFDLLIPILRPILIQDYCNHTIVSVYRELTIVRAKDWTNLLLVFRLWGRSSSLSGPVRNWTYTPGNTCRRLTNSKSHPIFQTPYFNSTHHLIQYDCCLLHLLCRAIDSCVMSSA